MMYKIKIVKTHTQNRQKEYRFMKRTIKQWYLRTNNTFKCNYKLVDIKKFEYKNIPY